MPKGKWQPPEAGDAPAEVKHILKSVYTSYRDEHPAERADVKARGARIAWGAVKKAGWRKDKKTGKWTKKGNKKFSEQEIIQMANEPEIAVESFRAGVYRGQEYGEDVLKDIAESYDPSVHEAPAIIGHFSSYKPDDRVPAYGWIGKVKKVGDRLKLVFSQFSEELKELYRKGYYKKVSIALYGPHDDGNPKPGHWYLRSLSFLGAVPPHVKGLAGVEGLGFAEFTTANTFSEFEFADEAQLEELESLAEEDTLGLIEEEFAYCLKTIQETLEDEQKEDCDARWACENALQTCYNKIGSALHTHFEFMSKAEDILGEEEETEMRETFGKRLKSLFGITTRKESDNMDEKQQKEFAERQTALEKQQKDVADREAKIAAKEKEFAEHEKQAQAAAATARTTAIKKQVLEFREECIKQKLPVQKLELDGFFALAESMLEANDKEFGENKKRPLDILKGLLAGMKPVETSAEFKEDDLLGGAIVGVNLNDKLPIDRKALVQVQFAEAYVQAHVVELEKELPGSSHIQKRAHVVEKVLMGQIPLDGNLLKK